MRIEKRMVTAILSAIITSTSLAQSPTPAASPAAAGSCVSTVPETEGPYYLNLNLVRSDITEGKPGVPLKLKFEVVSVGTCQPILGATVDVWHADALGTYSGFGSVAGEPAVGGGPPAGGAPGGNTPTNNLTFLRGSQITDPQGVVQFQSIYPGWYPGRTVHIHFKVHGASNVFTSQLFFDDALSDRIFQQAPYNTHTGNRVTNANDMVLNMSPDPNRTLFPQTTYANGTVTATIRVVVAP